MKNQKASLVAQSKKGNWRKYDSKEQIGGYHVVGIKKGKVRNPITVRYYMGRSNRASTVYCVLWASNDERIITGHGEAGGYGYHKQSAALSDAIRNAGIKLEKSISGVGDGAEREALQAIARDIHGYKGEITVLSF